MAISLNRLIESKQFRGGGSRFIFKQNANTASVIGGGVALNLPKAGGKIFAGDFAEFDAIKHTIKHLKQFIIVKDVTNTDTKILIKRDDFLHVLEPNLPIMVEPTKTDEFDYKGISVSTGTPKIIDDPTYGSCYEVTIAAAALGSETIPAGTLLVEAESVSADTSSTVFPIVKNANVCFTVDDSAMPEGALVEDESKAGSIKHIGTITYHHTILRRRHIGIPKIAPANKCAIHEYYEF